MTKLLTIEESNRRVTCKSNRDIVLTMEKTEGEMRKRYTDFIKRKHVIRGKHSELVLRSGDVSDNLPVEKTRRKD